MALPTSTIVLGLLTAVPFGLAIKDTVTGKGGIDVTSEDEDSDASELDRAGEAAQREWDEKKAMEKVERQNLINTLIPTNVATLGVRGYHLGSPVSPDAEQKGFFEDRAHAVFDPTTSPNGNLRSLTISFPQTYDDENVCQLVGRRLGDLWGTPGRTYKNGDTRKHFAAESPHQRVTFVEPEGSARCELILESYEDAASFVTKAETSTVPVWAIGKPAKVLTDKLGDDAFSNAEQIRWTRHGVGQGIGDTELYARIVKGKIVTITATFQASEKTIGEVAEKMVADFGTPTETDPVVWKKAKLSVATVDDTAGEYVLTAGDPLPEED